MRGEGPERSGKVGEMGEGRPVFIQVPWLDPVWLSEVANLAWVIAWGGGFCFFVSFFVVE